MTGGIAWSQAGAAQLGVSLACGADSAVAWRMRRDVAVRRVVVSLPAIVILPGAFLPQSWPAYPLAALAVGVACALVAGVSIAQVYRRTEAYWGRLSGSRLAAELDQAWRQRFGWLQVLAHRTQAMIYALKQGLISVDDLSLR